MSVSLGTVHASLELRLAKFKADIKEAKAELGNLETDTKRRAERIGQSLSSLGRSMSIGITAPLALMGKAALDSAVRMDSLTRSLTSLTGDSKETERQLVRLREAAKLPGLGFRELIEGSVRLQSAGFNAREAERALKGFGNALALAGGSKEDLREVGVQLAQIASSGKLQGDELRIIAERVPQVRAVLKEAFGTASSEEIMKFGLSIEQIMGAITTGLEKLPQATDSAQNKLDNFNDTLDDLKRTVGSAFLPAVTEGLDIIAKKVEEATKWFRELDPAAKKGLGQLAVGGAVMGPALLGLGALFGMFSKLAGSPFFKFLSGKMPIVGPMSAFAVSYAPQSAALEGAISLLPADQQAKLRKMQEDFKAAEQRSAINKAKMQGMTYDPISGKVRPEITPKSYNVPAPRFGKPPKVDKASADEAKRRGEFRDEYASEVELEVLERTPGKQFTTAIRRAEKDYQEAIKSGARRADAERVLMAELKKIAIEYEEWKTQHEEKALQKRLAKRARYTESGIGDPSGAMFGAMGLKAQIEQQLRYKPGAVGYGPAEAKAAALALEQAKLQGIFGGVGSSQMAQGASTVSSVQAIKDQLKRDKNLQRSLRGAFDFKDDLARNLGYEFANEFSLGFDKFFGNKNPFARALNRSLSRALENVLTGQFEKGIAGLSKGLSGALGGLFGGKGVATDKGGGVAQGIMGLIGSVALGGLLGGFGGGIGKFLGGLFKAEGGPVRAGFPYVVGERGPELFVPKQSGMVMANGSGGVTINMSGTVIRSEADIDALAWKLTRRMRARPGS